MSKNLAILQKCARIFSILARIALIVSIAGAVTGLAATMLWIRWNTAPAADIPAIAQLFALIDQGTYYKTLALLIDDTITCAMAAPLYGAVLRYLKAELADGTPFTDSGAAALRRLGVLTIVLPIISLALRTIPYSAFAVALPGDRSNVETVIPGIMLILMSVVCRYGAELAAARPEAAIMAGTEAEKEMI